jgi:hypothetical protein
VQEASVFDPSAPDGDYELDMSNPCAVLFMLMLPMLMLLMLMLPMLMLPMLMLPMLMGMMYIRCS